MKKNNILTIAILTVFLSATVFFINACKKSTFEQSDEKKIIDNKSSSMVNYILNFKKKMEYYKNNPGLKSNEKKQVDESVTDWESTINLIYCYSYLELSDVVVYDTIIALPTISEDSILMTDVSDKYYNEIVYAVQSQYFQAPFPDSVKKLMVVDLEKTVGGDSLSITSMIGNTIPCDMPAYDWYWGEKQGVCISHQYITEQDAATIAAQNTRNYFHENPPQGTHWYFINVENHFIKNPVLYPNPENQPPNDNFEDYLVYYADANIGNGLTENVRCLENATELAFYKQNYINFTQNWIDDSNGKKFKDCFYEGKEKTYPIHIILHRLKNTWIGFRYHTEIAINNIANY